MFFMGKQWIKKDTNGTIAMKNWQFLSKLTIEAFKQKNCTLMFREALFTIGIRGKYPKVDQQVNR